jgi:hypothetical protein
MYSAFCAAFRTTASLRVPACTHACLFTVCLFRTSPPAVHTLLHAQDIIREG